MNQHFPNELEPLPLNLTNFWTSVNKSASPNSLPSASSFESEAHSKLEDLGITSELLQNTTTNSANQCLSNRDCINGTYRIILHRLQKQSNPMEREDLHEKIVNEELSTSWTRSMSVIGEPGGRRDSFGKPISMSYGGTTVKSKRAISQPRPQRVPNGNTQQPTKVCVIL